MIFAVIAICCVHMLLSWEFSYYSHCCFEMSACLSCSLRDADDLAGMGL